METRSEPPAPTLSVSRMKQPKRVGWTVVEGFAKGHLEQHHIPDFEDRHAADLFCICKPWIVRNMSKRLLIVNHRSQIQEVEIPSHLPEQI